MKLEYNLDMKDIMSFQKYFIETSPEWQRQKKNRYIVIPTLMSLICMFDYLWHKRISFGLLLFFGLLSLFWLLHVKRNFEARILYSFEQALEEGDTTDLFAAKTLEINDTGLIYTGADSKQKVSWQEVSKVEKTGEYYFIIVDTFISIIIPTQRLNLSENEAEKLNDILENHRRETT